MSNPAFADSVLHAGDKVSVTVYNHPELSVTTLTLDALGYASLPLAGSVPAADVAPSVLAERIRLRLSRFVRHAAVDVQLLQQTNAIFINGGPGGTLTFQPGETLVSAIGQLAPPAGGSSTDPQPSTSKDAVSDSLQYSGIDLRHVVVRRGGFDLPAVDVREALRLGTGGVALQPGDNIVLKYRPIPVRVEGEVRRPGLAYLYDDEPLSDAIQQSGGATQTGSTQRIDLTRGGVQTLITTSSPEYQAPVQLGDLLYVPHDVRVAVVGSVEKPGEVELHGTPTVLSALYFAGGPTKKGDIRYVKVVHDGVQSEYNFSNLTHGAPAADPPLSDGDTVFVPEGHDGFDFTLLFAGLIAASELTRF